MYTLSLQSEQTEAHDATSVDNIEVIEPHPHVEQLPESHSIEEKPALPEPIELDFLEGEDEMETEPYQVMQSVIDEELKTVTRPAIEPEADTRQCAFDGCKKTLNNPRPNQKYCNVNCRNNAHKARKAAQVE